MTTKLCNICGLTIDSSVDECPNCGSHDFDTGNIFNIHSKKRKISKYDSMDAW